MNRLNDSGKKQGSYLDSVEETESATRRFVEVVLPCLERLETIQE